MNKTTINQISELLETLGYNQLAADVRDGIYTPLQGVRFASGTRLNNPAEKVILSRAQAVLAKMGGQL